MLRQVREIRARHYAVAIGSPLVMLGLRLGLDPSLHNSASLLPFMLAVFVSGWYGGWVPGQVATIWSAVLGSFCVLPPRGSFFVDRPQDRLTLCIFIVIGSLISLMSGRLRRSERLGRERNAALAASEGRFRATFDQAAVGIAQVSPSGRWVRVNARLCEIVGYPCDELLTLTFQDITYAEDLDKDLRQVDRLLKGEIDHYTIEKRYLRKDGSIVWVNLTVALVLTKEGKPDYFISVIEDVSARKAAEAELRQLQGELETRVEERTRALQEANHQLEAFSYTVSHDLRAPLRGIQGFARALVEDASEKLADEERDYLRRIENGASRMERLIDDLLAYSHLSRQQLTLGVVELETVVRDALAVVAEEVRRSGASVEVDVDACRVRAHRPTLSLAIQNLVTNAVKFVPENQRPRVRVRCERRAGRVRLWVEDEGIGIAPEHQERIFGVFERLHSRDHYPGTGVGLAIVSKAIERMGGSVGVESEEGKGSRFWIELLPGET